MQNSIQLKIEVISVLDLLPLEGLKLLAEFVTFLRAKFKLPYVQEAIDLQTYNIQQAEAVELRSRLATFAEDWDSPEMSIYDHYDTYKAKI